MTISRTAVKISRILPRIAVNRVRRIDRKEHLTVLMRINQRIRPTSGFVTRGMIIHVASTHCVGWKKAWIKRMQVWGERTCPTRLTLQVGRSCTNERAVQRPRKIPVIRKICHRARAREPFRASRIFESATVSMLYTSLMAQSVALAWESARAVFSWSVFGRDHRGLHPRDLERWWVWTTHTNYILYYTFLCSAVLWYCGTFV